MEEAIEEDDFHLFRMYESMDGLFLLLGRLGHEPLRESRFFSFPQRIATGVHLESEPGAIRAWWSYSSLQVRTITEIGSRWVGRKASSPLESDPCARADSLASREFIVPSVSVAKRFVPLVSAV